MASDTNAAATGRTFKFTKKVIPEFSGVGQRLDDTVHETGVAQVDQSSETRQAHFLLLLVFMVLLAGRKGMAHGLHHAGGFGLNQDRVAGLIKTVHLSSKSQFT